MRALKLGTTVLVGGLAVAACGSATDVVPRFTTTDSAGIEVVHSRTPRWGQLAVDDAAFEFGEMSGADHLMFDRIRGVTRLDDGAIAVGNQGTNTIRIFDETGSLLSEFGGDGEGPGEFTLLRGVRRCEAGLITAFEYNYRQVLFDRQGRFLESHMITFPGDRFGVYRLSCDREGRIVGTSWGDAGTWDHPVGMYRSEGGLYAADSAVGPFVQIGTTVVDDRVRWTEGEGPHPFGRTTVVAAFQDGFVLGTADIYSFTMHAWTGDPTRLVRWDGPARPLLDAHASEYLAWRLTDAVERDHPAIRREVAEYEMPDSVPAYSDARVSPDGVIWVRAFATPWRSSSRWWGFLPTGEWAWELLLEPGFEVSEFGPNEVLGVVTDELGIERVRGYRLELARDSTRDQL